MFAVLQRVEVFAWSRSETVGAFGAQVPRAFAILQPADSAGSSQEVVAPLSDRSFPDRVEALVP